MKRVVLWATFSAVVCVAAIARADDDPLSAHIQALRTGSETERLQAALALFDLGPKAKPAVPALADALYAPQTEIKIVAVAALARLGPDAVEAAAALASRLDDPDEGVRATAISALESLGPAAAQALAQASDNGSSLARRNAASLLEILDSGAAPRVPVLVAGLREEDYSTVSSRARGRLEHLPITELIRILRAGEDDTTRYQTISALGRKGSDALPALRYLAQELQNTESASDVRVAAAWTLGQIGRPAKPAEGLLITALETDPYFAVQAQAAQALGKIGSDSPAAIESLVRGLSAKESQLRGACAVALSRLGEKAAPAVEPLTKMLASNPKAEKLEPYIAAAALGAIGREAAPAVPQLTPMLAHAHPDMRNAAAYALGRIGPAAASAIPALRDAATVQTGGSAESITAAREAATRAIAQIERHTATSAK